MQMTWKALAALLSYPTAELVQAMPEIAGALEREQGIGRESRQGLQALMHALAARDLLELQEDYVAQFDRGRATSLHLFEHVHGESRDRGPAMVDLLQTYERAGLRLLGGELPDYLPALLEFLSLASREQAQEMLADCAHILRSIEASLTHRESPYAAVFSALLDAAGERTGNGDVQAAPKEKSLDEEWAEEPVVFGPAAATSCGIPGAQTSVMQFVPGPARKKGGNHGIGQ